MEYKILLFTYKALNGQALSYLKELIVPFYPTRTLSSQNAGLPVVSGVSKMTRSTGTFSIFGTPWVIVLLTSLVSVILQVLPCSVFPTPALYQSRQPCPAPCVSLSQSLPAYTGVSSPVPHSLINLVCIQGLVLS